MLAFLAAARVRAVARPATLPEDGSQPAGWSRYLLVRRALTRNAKGEHELACYLCCAPAAPPMKS